MTKTEQLAFLQRELHGYKEAIGKAADTIIENEVSEYPIFVVHQQQMDMGILIIDKDKVRGNWSVNASTLEEFVTKQIITPQKIDEFQDLYDKHINDLCLFVLSELGANFIFIKRKI